MLWTVTTTTTSGTTTQAGQRQIYRQGDGETVEIYSNPASRARSRWGFVVATHIRRGDKDVRGTIRYDDLGRNPFLGNGPFTLSESQSPLFDGSTGKRINGVPRGEGDLTIGTCTFHVMRYELTRYEMTDNGFRPTTTVQIGYVRICRPRSSPRSRTRTAASRCQPPISSRSSITRPTSGTEQETQGGTSRVDPAGRRPFPSARRTPPRFCPSRPIFAPSPPPRSSEPLPRYALTALIVACALFMENLDGTVISTALPAIARDLHEDPISLKLALTSYLLALAVFIPASGWMADKFGTRTVFRTAIVVFTAGSICCGLSSSASRFILARVLQGRAAR